MNFKQMNAISRLLSTLLKDDKTRTVLESMMDGKADVKTLDSARDALGKDMLDYGKDISNMTEEELNAYTENKKNAYNELYNTYKPKGQVLQNVVTPIVSNAASLAGNGYNLYSQAVAALIANSAKGLNHSQVTNNLREGAAELAPIFAMRGAMGKALGDTISGTTREIADKYKADDEPANRQAYAASNSNASGTMYYNLDRGDK